MVIFQYNLYIFGIHLWTVLYPKSCYNEPCNKEVEVYLMRNLILKSVDPDLTWRSVATDLGLHSLLRPVCPRVNVVYRFHISPPAGTQRSDNVASTSTFWNIFIFFQKKGFDTTCKLSPWETICMKYQSLFSEKNKKNISHPLSLPGEW